MSLITLSSSTKNNIQQQPFNFKNHFPQPLLIKPNSQVCLTNFYHFRDEGFYYIHGNNNIIAYMIGGDRNYNGIRYARLQNGQYSGASLATECTRALNSVLLQENYTFTVAFTAGNPQANPPTTDKFQLSFANVATPNPKGGVWTNYSFNSADLQITNNDTDNNKSAVKANTADDTKVGTRSCLLKKGLRLHEGFYSSEAITAVVRNSTAYGGDKSTMRIASFNMGITRYGCSNEDDGDNVNNAHEFNSDFSDILVRGLKSNNQNKIVISTLRGRRGRGDFYSFGRANQLQLVRRRFNDAFVKTVFTNVQTLMKIRIDRNSTNRAFVVRLEISNDNGASYTFATDGFGGNNTDGRPNVYTQTIGGVSYNGVLYSSMGVPDGAGGLVPSTASLNQAIVKDAPFIPFFDLKRPNISLDNLNLDGVEIESNSINSPAVALTANQKFKLSFTRDTSKGYDFVIGISTPATTPLADNNETTFNNFAIKQDSLTSGDQGADTGERFKVYADKTVNISTNPNVIGSLIFVRDNSGAGFGLATFFGLNNFNPAIGHPFVFHTQTQAISNLYSEKDVLLTGIFNGVGNPPTLTNGDITPKTKPLHIDVDDLEATTFIPDSSVPLGADFDQPFSLLVGNPTQNDIANNSGTPLRLDGNVEGGSAGITLGLRENVYQLGAGVATLDSDSFPFKTVDDNSIHISVPELSNVQSLEGEAENVGKTIAVIPKNEFTTTSTSQSMTWRANYDDWIDINNQNELDLNELNLQVRKPNGTMATSLQQITRATLKIRQDPSKMNSHNKQERNY